MVINNCQRKRNINLREEDIDIQMLKEKNCYTTSCSVIFINLFSFVLFADNYMRNASRIRGHTPNEDGAHFKRTTGSNVTTDS